MRRARGMGACRTPVRGKKRWSNAPGRHCRLFLHGLHLATFAAHRYDIILGRSLAHRSGEEDGQRTAEAPGRWGLSRIVEFFKAIAGICSTEPLGPDLWKLEGGKAAMELSKVPQLTNPGGAVYLSGKGLKDPILIVNGDGGEFHCFSNRCTHMGRRLDPAGRESNLRCCSVSHSTFDYYGNVLRGPAKSVIQVYQCDIRNGVLEIVV